ncbi:MAG: asparagine synthase C-terminal domain-containing protein [candidate division KSB1 bacterium]|nr:asparagine synthase C-terminal domain-containing protein [candidate division KSB1 bacterium]
MMHGAVLVTPDGRKELQVKFRTSGPADRSLFSELAANERYQLAIRGDLLGCPGGEAPAGCAKRLLDRLSQEGPALFRKLNGGFAAALFDRQSGELILVRDHLGVEALYFRLTDEGHTEFSTSLRALAAGARFPEALDYDALATYLTLNYNPSGRTLIRNVHKVPPGCLVRIQGSQVTCERYWSPDFGNKFSGSVGELIAELRSQFDRAVRVRLPENEQVGVSVSGGMDSSTVMAFASQYRPGQLRAFSFRCPVETYDESHYASLVARHYGATYEQVEYTPERALAAAEMVRHMDEPQADLGIEVATFLLGQHASGKIEVLLTGDGGDELFAGHPVYLADRAARAWERVPAFARWPVTWVARLIPESHRKSSLSVKLKRFVQGQRFPRAFHSNRWRLYYSPRELEALLSPGLWPQVREGAQLAWLRELYAALPWPDELDRALFGDYYTVVQFYLRRLSLLRAFGIRARCPLLDPQLVDFCARIPGELKIPNSREQKYIQKKAMEGILPDAIVYRKDKLGHSVPMRKWLREDNVLSAEVRQTLLRNPRIVQWELVRADRLEEMIRETSEGRHDHSHRLWALYVLELWLRSWEELNLQDPVA